MNTSHEDRASVARSFLFGLNLLIACAAQIAAALELVQSLATAAPK
ncbi:MAG TPA: hypothetical protein VFB36_03410 [Nevskiaceae bacterium]|nr:hypothetical protein [Nevskiaceae bacterium]